MRLPERVPPLVQWIVLILVAAALVALVEPGFVESPYNGF